MEIDRRLSMREFIPNLFVEIHLFYCNDDRRQGDAIYTHEIKTIFNDTSSKNYKKKTENKLQPGRLIANPLF